MGRGAGPPPPPRGPRLRHRGSVPRAPAGGPGRVLRALGVPAPRAEYAAGGPGEEPEVLDLGDECDAAAVVRGRPWLVRAGALEPAETEGWKPPEGWVLDIDVAGAPGGGVLAIGVAPQRGQADGDEHQGGTAPGRGLL